MADPQPNMKAWTFEVAGFPDCLSLNTVPAPTSSQVSSTQLLVRVHAAALNPVDIQIMNILLWNVPLPPFNARKGTACDFSGTVIAAGKDTGFKAADEIFGVSMFQGWNSVLNEVALVDTNHGCFAKKPSSWSWEKASSLTVVWLTARAIIEHATPTMEQVRAAGRTPKLVVLGGSSATGMYAVHLGQERGWTVLSTCSSRNTDFVKGMGANEVVDYTSTNVPNAVKKFGPDAILDCVGGTDCIYLAKRYITIVGDKTARTSLGGALTYIYNPAMVIRWALGRLGLSSTEYSCNNIILNQRWLEETYNLPIDKIVIDSTFEFEQAKEAFERLNTSRARGKVVVKVSS